MPGHAGTYVHLSRAFQAIMQRDTASSRMLHGDLSTAVQQHGVFFFVQPGQSFRKPVPTVRPHAGTTWLWSRLACVEHWVTPLQVGLIRQMERSQKEFQDWRREREREVMQLRRQVSTCQLCLQHCSQQHIPYLFLQAAQAAQKEQPGAVLAAPYALYTSNSASLHE